MANIPDRYTQEAQDERDMRKKLEAPKSRWSWSYSDIPDEDWPFKKEEDD
jgi:hypothetical protein